jgi:4-hydroxymandelate oxidase
VAAVDGAAGVLVDGGIRSGRDVVTALALGADAVCVARPLLWALALGGAPAVEQWLAELTADVVETLRLCGVAALTALTADLIAAPRT